MIEKVRSCMEEYGMFPENGNIVVGVSGGADSVCLLRVLAALRDSCRLNLTAVHINHGLRKEAGQDADYVKQLCACWNIPFILIEEDVEALAKREHLSCEEAGRNVRYAAFLKVLADMEQKAPSGQTAADLLEHPAAEHPTGGCIAVAHNSDDRAETLLFHMLRGSGLTGMGSIRPVRMAKDGSRIIRPLLFCTREEIEAFLKKENLCWRTDATNQEDLYTRNKIRNRILPYAQEHISNKAKEHLAQEAQLLAETSDFIGRMTREAMERCSSCEKDGSLHFDTVLFAKEDPYLQQQMVLRGLLQIGTGKDLTAAHVEQAQHLFDAGCQSGRRMELPACRVRVERQFDTVVMRTLEVKSAVPKECRIALQEGRVKLPELGETVIQILKNPEKTGDGDIFTDTFLHNIPEKKYTKWFDYDKIIESAEFRTRRTGDYLTIGDSGAKKSLKRYLIEEKIPANRRNELMLLADGPHVMWVPGHRISAAYKVTEQTKRILQIHLTGGKEDDRESGDHVD